MGVHSGGTVATHLPWTVIHSVVRHARCPVLQPVDQQNNSNGCAAQVFCHSSRTSVRGESALWTFSAASWDPKIPFSLACNFSIPTRECRIDLPLRWYHVWTLKGPDAPYLEPSIARTFIRSDRHRSIHGGNRTSCGAAPRCAGIRNRLPAASRWNCDSSWSSNSAHHRPARRHCPRAHRPRQHAPRRRFVGGAARLARQSVDVQPTQDATSVGFRTKIARRPRRAQSAAHRRSRSRRQHHLRRRARPAHRVQSRRLHRLQGNARRRALLRTRRQDRLLRPPQPGLHALEHGPRHRGVARSHLQEHPVLPLHQRWTQLRPLSRQHLAHLVRLRQAVARHVLLRRRRRPAQLLPDLRPHSEAGRRGIHLPHRHAAACLRCGRSASSSPATATHPNPSSERSPIACAPTRFPPTWSISTSTTSSATVRSPSIPSPFPDSPAWSPIFASSTSTSS